jgi:hypothetical protein
MTAGAVPGAAPPSLAALRALQLKVRVCPLGGRRAERGVGGVVQNRGTLVAGVGPARLHCVAAARFCSLLHALPPISLLLLRAGCLRSSARCPSSCRPAPWWSATRRSCAATCPPPSLASSSPRRWRSRVEIYSSVNPLYYVSFQPVLRSSGDDPATVINVNGGTIACLSIAVVVANWRSAFVTLFV